MREKWQHLTYYHQIAILRRQSRGLKKNQVPAISELVNSATTEVRIIPGLFGQDSFFFCLPYFHLVFWLLESITTDKLSFVYSFLPSPFLLLPASNLFISPIHFTYCCLPNFPQYSFQIFLLKNHLPVHDIWNSWNLAFPQLSISPISPLNSSDSTPFISAQTYHKYSELSWVNFLLFFSTHLNPDIFKGLAQALSLQGVFTHPSNILSTPFFGQCIIICLSLDTHAHYLLDKTNWLENKSNDSTLTSLLPNKTHKLDKSLNISLWNILHLECHSPGISKL